MNHQGNVFLASCENYDPVVVEKAMDHMLDSWHLGEKELKGKTVGIKANLVTFKKPEAAATTHPVLLEQLVRRLKEQGADVIVGDSPGGVYSSAYLNRVYAVTGLRSVETAGGRLNQNFEEKDISFPEGKTAHEFHYTSWIDDCDLLINFSKLKTHGMMGMSCAVKNMFGLIPGTYKPEYHFRYADPLAFAEMLVDLNDCFPCDFYLVDGVVGMEGNGPTAGTPRQVGCLLGSEDPHALDEICAQIIGLKPAEIPTIAAAIDRGYCDGDPSHVKTDTDPSLFAVTDYQNIPNAGRLMEQDGNEQLWGKAANRLMLRFIAAKPKPVTEECIGCGKCAEVCPAKAIVMKNRVPVIDRKHCIRCFCCQEFCPRGAMKVYRPVIARIAGRM